MISFNKCRMYYNENKELQDDINFSCKLDFEKIFAIRRYINNSHNKYKKYISYYDALSENIFDCTNILNHNVVHITINILYLNNTYRHTFFINLNDYYNYNSIYDYNNSNIKPNYNKDNSNNIYTTLYALYCSIIIKLKLFQNVLIFSKYLYLNINSLTWDMNNNTYNLNTTVTY